MNDRVRIYELARQMNLQNQDLIVALRELGYDIKSHSSTIDSHTVGLLIAHLGKKKQGDKGKPAAAKAPGKPAPGKIAPPPEPVVVKPRVLSRRKPTPPPGAEPLEPTPTEDAPAAPPEVDHAPAAQAQPPAPPAQPAPPASPTSPPAQASNPIPPTAAPPAPTQPRTAAEEAAAWDQAGQQGRTIRKLDLPPPKQQPEPTSKTDSKPETDAEKADKAKKPPGEDDSASKAFDKLQAHRPMSPSVPIRIAAPSIRATPPRPPKSHRPQQSTERHQQHKKEEKSRPAAATIEVPKVITLTGSLTVKELAERMAISETEIIKRLFMKGFMRTVNQLVELELAKDLAVEMEYEVLSEETAPVEEESVEKVELTEEEQSALVTRPPVVTIMGHVDHGKTSLLDAIRQTKFLLTASEAGGITQHIGAYHVEVPGEDGHLRQIVFLDTPGHEAFTAMRARGAKVTDIAILVVAADDGVMPQTIEAIDHAKAAGVPIIVAVNKVDKAEADPDRVLNQLMEHGLLPDRYGGETVTVNVSAKKRTGLDDLLEMILLVADMQDLKANPERPAIGTIVEAELSKGRGAVATALIQNGTLREGDFIVAGSKYGRVRALFDDRGQRIKAAGPSMPVEVLGLDEAPFAGDPFQVVEDAQAQRILVESRKENETGLKRTQHVSLETLHDLLEQGEVKELNVIVKADVQGTAEAIADQVRKLTSTEVQVNVVRVASGAITENDVNLAASSEAIIIGFNVEPDANANRVKETMGVDIRQYNIIYQITDDLEKAIQGLIEPSREEVQIGTAEIRQIFKFGKNLTIAGCYVTSGKIQRGASVKITRAGAQIYEGKLENLKRFKDDVKEVATNFECGMSFQGFNEVQEGDIVNAFVIQETKREPTRS